MPVPVKVQPLTREEEQMANLVQGCPTVEGHQGEVITAAARGVPAEPPSPVSLLLRFLFPFYPATKHTLSLAARHKTSLMHSPVRGDVRAT